MLAPTRTNPKEEHHNTITAYRAGKQNQGR